MSLCYPKADQKLLNLLLYFRQNFRNYEANGSKKHEKFFCCIHGGAIDADDDLEVLDVLMIPELHIFIGIVNRLVRALNDKLGDDGYEDRFYKWCDKNYILYTGFHSKVWSMTCLQFTCVNIN